MTEVAAAAAVEEEGTGVDVERGGGGGGAKETFKDLFAGAAGGVAQVLIGEFIWIFSFFFYETVLVWLSVISIFGGYRVSLRESLLEGCGGGKLHEGLESNGGFLMGGEVKGKDLREYCNDEEEERTGLFSVVCISSQDRLEGVKRP